MNNLIQWRRELPQWLLLAGMFLLAALSWHSAPDRIPIHWNAAGEIDSYGGRFEGLLGIPLLTLGLYLVFLILPRVDPGRANYPRFGRAYAVIRTAVILLMAVVYGILHLTLRGHHIDVGTVVPLLIGVLFVTLGNVMGKIRPNWFVGIRTPWTLSSKAAWVRTHRLGGWLFVLAGLCVLAAGVFWPQRAETVILVTSISAAVILTVYSYFVWRRDPGKVPPAGTAPAE